MAPYEVVFRPSVAKDFHGIPQFDIQRILDRINALRTDPRPPGVEKLSAQERYRLRQGVYRIIYGVDDSRLAVEVVKVGHRSAVYRSD